MKPFGVAGWRARMEGLTLRACVIKQTLRDPSAPSGALKETISAWPKTHLFMAQRSSDCAGIRCHPCSTSRCVLGDVPVPAFFKEPPLTVTLTRGVPCASHAPHHFMPSTVSKPSSPAPKKYTLMPGRKPSCRWPPQQRRPRIGRAMWRRGHPPTSHAGTKIGTTQRGSGRDPPCGQARPVEGPNSPVFVEFLSLPIRRSMVLQVLFFRRRRRRSKPRHFLPSKARAKVTAGFSCPPEDL